MALLSLRGVKVQIGTVEVLRGIDFEIQRGETLGVVGESGCGKTMTGLAVMGMLPTGGRITAGEAILDGLDLRTLTPHGWGNVRGKTVAMVMQDPFTSLNPMMRVGNQIAEIFRNQLGASKQSASASAIEMLHRVGIPSPEDAALRFPHQMSGGQRQRVVIAIAFAARPKLLIADEPTTALDVTLQAQILRLLQDLQREAGTAVMLVSHDIGVIAAVSHHVCVLYAGRVVESGSAHDVLGTPQHPYTSALLAALPRPGVERLSAIEGQPPDLRAMPTGCSFQPRCPVRFEPCDVEPVAIPLAPNRACACWRTGR